MKTLIDRDKLYKALAQWDWQDLYLPVHFKELVDDLPVERHSYEDGVRKGYEDAVRHYAKMALKQDVLDSRVGQWIPVSERLPGNERYVLVTTVSGDVTDAKCLQLNGSRSRLWVKGLAIMSVTAWMPLPEPYKEEKQ